MSETAARPDDLVPIDRELLERAQKAARATLDRLGPPTAEDYVIGIREFERAGIPVPEKWREIAREVKP